MAKTVILRNNISGGGSSAYGYLENGIQYMGFSPNYNTIEENSVRFESEMNQTSVAEADCKLNVKFDFKEEDKGVVLEMPSIPICDSTGEYMYNPGWMNVKPGSEEAKKVAVIPVYIAMHNAVLNDVLAMEGLAQAWMIKGAGPQYLGDHVTKRAHGVQIVNDSLATGSGDNRAKYLKVSHACTFQRGKPCCMKTGTDTTDSILYNAWAALRTHAAVLKTYYVEGKNVTAAHEMINDVSINPGCYIQNINGPLKIFPGEYNNDLYAPVPKGRTKNGNNENYVFMYTKETSSTTWGGGYAALNSLHFTTYENTTTDEYDGISVFIPRSNGQSAIEIKLTSGIYVPGEGSEPGLTHYYAYFMSTTNMQNNNWYIFDISGNNSLDFYTGYTLESPVNIEAGSIYNKITPIKRYSRSGAGVSLNTYAAPNISDMTGTDGALLKTGALKTGPNVGVAEYISSFTTSFKMYLVRTKPVEGSKGTAGGVFFVSIDGVLVDNTWAYSEFSNTFGVDEVKYASLTAEQIKRRNYNVVNSHNWHTIGEMPGPLLGSLLLMQQACGEEGHRYCGPNRTLPKQVNSTSEDPKEKFKFFLNKIIVPNKTGDSFGGTNSVSKFQSFFYTSHEEIKSQDVTNLGKAKPYVVNNSGSIYSGLDSSWAIDEGIYKVSRETLDYVKATYPGLINTVLSASDPSSGTLIYNSTLLANNTGQHPRILPYDASCDGISYGSRTLKKGTSANYAGIIEDDAAFCFNPGLYNYDIDYYTKFTPTYLASLLSPAKNYSDSSTVTAARIGQLSSSVSYSIDFNSITINEIPLRYLTTSLPLEAMNEKTPNKISFKFNIHNKAGAALDKLVIKFIDVFTEDLSSNIPDNPSKVFLPVTYKSDMPYFNAEVRLPLIAIDEDFCHNMGTNAFVGAPLIKCKFVVDVGSGNYTLEESSLNDIPGLHYDIQTSGERQIENGVLSYNIDIYLYNNSDTLGFFDYTFGVSKGVGYSGKVPIDVINLSDILGKVMVKGTTVDKDGNPIDTTSELLFNSNSFSTTAKEALNCIPISDNTIFANKALAQAEAAKSEDILNPSNGNTDSPWVNPENDESVQLAGLEDEIINFNSTISEEPTNEIPINGSNILVIDRTTGNVNAVSLDVNASRDRGNNLHKTVMDMLKGRCLTKEILPLLSNQIILH